jgi:hypothetical protein
MNKIIRIESRKDESIFIEFEKKIDTNHIIIPKNVLLKINIIGGIK